MKSARGVFAAIVFFLALPVAALCELALNRGGGPAMHFMLALGAGVLATSVADFRTPKWAAWLGRISLGALAIIFLLQGASEVVHNAALTYLAFQILGQRLEGWLVIGFLLWCATILAFDSHGWIRAVGLLAVIGTLSVRVYALSLSPRDVSSSLKLIYLTPFVWLLLESKKKRESPK